ncbi:MAG: rhodanese-like domain-containing protein [Pseudomonadota bacterium]|nr:rhodanese-like domain-containing protein [Pseudomonadota bacterium]
MIRDRIKNTAKKAALKFFGMEWDASERPVDHGKGVASTASFDPSLIPRVVDGSGDTPGPKHREDIGRTWLASQVISNVSPYLIDIRHPNECAGGLIQGARLLPGNQVKQRLDLLPEKEMRVTVYDQVGSDDASALAEWLREQGWHLARRLRGGYAEWIEHSEPITVPAPPDGARYMVGQQVERTGGGRFWVQEALPGAIYTLWSENGTFTTGVREDELRR